GVELILEKELKQLGLKTTRTIPGGVELKGDIQTIHRANVHSRTANRIVARIAEFHASSFHELERRAKKIEWERFVSRGQSVRFRVTCRKSKLYHSDAVAERFENVLASKLDAKIADRIDGSDDDDINDGQLFIVRFLNDICVVSADTSGDLLYRRGYRQAVAKAPLRETLAAAMLIGSEWDISKPLVDPMCGSGTIAIEGAMMARNIAPGVARSFAFENWPDHDPTSLQLVRNAARAAERSSSGTEIVASDRDAGAVEAARANADRAGVGGDLAIEQKPLSAAHLPEGKGWIVSNPPYGLRIGESGQLRNLYSTLGRILRERAPEYVLALLSADRKLEGQVGIDFSEMFRTTNGGIPVRLVTGRYE
ncbi:MAG TPA: class I SAM-dependent RNA methyltransferase, partial [Gemmatimonadaceae bacterium]